MLMNIEIVIEPEHSNREYFLGYVGNSPVYNTISGEDIDELKAQGYTDEDIEYYAKNDPFVPYLHQIKKSDRE